MKNNPNLFILLTVFLVGACLYIPVDGYSVGLFNVTAQDGAPTDVTFSINGAKMFVIGDDNDAVYEYVLSTPFNINTTTFTAFFNVTSQDNTPTGVTFSNDGTKMFVIGLQHGNVHEYALSVPYNVISSTFSRSFNVTLQETFPEDVTFSNDGAKMFVIGKNNVMVYEYILSTPFNISNPTFIRSIDIRNQDSFPTDVTFSNDGTRMFVLGTSNVMVYEYSLSTPFNVTSSTFTDSISVGSQDNFPSGVTFSNDGTRMFVLGYTNNLILEYALYAPFDLNVSPPTFTARSVSSTQTIVTFSEGVFGILNFSEWRFDGGSTTMVSGHVDNGTLAGITELVFIHDITNDHTPDVVYAGTSLTSNSSNVMLGATVTAADGTPPTFTARSVSSTQTTVTFSEGVFGILNFSEWRFDGGSTTMVSGHVDNGTLAGITELVFIHDNTNDHTPDVRYIGTSLADSSSNVMNAVTVTAANGIVPTFTAQSDFFIQTIITFSDGIYGTLNFSEWSIAGNTPTAVSGHADGDTLSGITRLVFIHNITNEHTPSVVYTGTSLADVASVVVPATTVTAADGIPSTFTARSVSSTQTTVTFSEGVFGILNFSEWRFDGGSTTMVSGHVDNGTLAGITELVFIHDITNDHTPDVRYVGTSLADSSSNVMNAVTVTAANGIVPTFTAQSDFFIQTLITFSDGIYGTLNFSEWSFAGNTPTAVSGHADGDRLSDIARLVFVHNITNEHTPSVAYTGTSLADDASAVVPATTVTASNGIPSTFTKSYSTTQSTYIGAQDTGPTSVAFSNDGAKMFVIGTSSDAVHEYKLSVPFNVTSSNFTANFDVNPQVTTGLGITFSPNGAKMFVVGFDSNGDAVLVEYALSTPFNVTSSTFTDSISVNSKDSYPTGVAFSNDGAKMFVIGPRSDAVHEYSLSTPFSVTSYTFTDSISVGSQDTVPQGVAFSTNGAKMFVVGIGNDAVYEYALSTPFNVTSSTFTDSISVGSQDTTPTGVTFSANGAKMFVVGFDTDKVYEYTLPTPFDLYTLAFTARSYSPTQTTVTFSEGLSGTLVLSEWSIDGNVPTAVLEHSDGDTLSGTTFLVFTHDTTNDQTPNVAYTGSSLTDNSSSAMAIATVTATDGIPLTITSITSDATTLGALKVGDTITFTLTPSLAEIEATIDGTFNSQLLNWSTVNNGITYTATYTVSEGDADQTTLLQITNIVITDSAGNTSLPFDGTDILKTIDANSPVITLHGANPQTIMLGAGYTELGATTSDGSLVTINAAEFTNVVGTYSIYYESTDTSGNTATQVVRTVNVIEATIPTFCAPPSSGDWIITNSCTVNNSATAQGTVIVQNNSILIIPSGITLDIDFAAFNLTVQSGSGVLIKSGGTIT